MMPIRMVTAWLRPLASVFAVVAALALSACGGGSGAPNNPYEPPPPVVPALVILPAAPTLYSQVATALTISGGVAPYRVFSSNTAVLPIPQVVPASTVSLLAATVKESTPVTITVQDAAGTSVSVTATVLPGPSSPPPALTVLPNPVSVYSNVASMLSVTGGVPPYKAFSSNSNFLPVSASVSNNALMLLAADVSATQTVTVTIQDAVNQQVPVTVTILPKASSTLPLSVLPNPINIYASIPSLLTASGGTPPYRAFSNNSTILPVAATFTGSTLQLNANDVSASTIVTVTVQDASSQTVPVLVTVFPKPTTPVPALVVLPASITVAKASPGTLTISGGVAPFKAYSSNPGILPIAQAVTGNSIPLAPSAVAAATAVTVTVQDAVGQTIQIAVNVVPEASPAPLALLPNTAIVFSGVATSLTVSGGTPPYSAFTTNSAVLPVTKAVVGGAIPLLAAPVTADTPVTVSVQDASNTIATATVTVRPAALLNTLTIKPNLPDCDAGAICSGQSGTATVQLQLPGGGPAAGRQVRFDAYAGPYKIAAANGSVVPSLVVTSDAGGKAQVIIRANVDAPTQPAQILVTDLASGQQLIGDFLIQQRTSGATILTIVPSEANITAPYKGECSFGFLIDYFIYGGTPPYRITQGFPDGSVIVNPIVNASGGFFEVVTNGACVKPQTFSILDATGRQTTATLNNVEGTTDRPVYVAPDLVVVPGDISGLDCTGGALYEFVVTGGTAPYNVSASPRVGTSPSINPTYVETSGATTRISNIQRSIVLTFVDSTRPAQKTIERKITCTGDPNVPPSVTPDKYDYAASTCVGKTSNFVVTGGTAPYFVRFAPTPSYVGPAISPTVVSNSGGGFAVTGLQNTSTGGSPQNYLVITDSQGAQVIRSITCP